MAYVLVCRGVAGVLLGNGSAPAEGRFLEMYDPEFAQGIGQAKWTADPAKAIRFATITEALAFWRQTSKTQPTRPDGRPNRPLTAYTIEISELKEDRA